MPTIFKTSDSWINLDTMAYARRSMRTVPNPDWNPADRNMPLSAKYKAEKEPCIYVEYPAMNADETCCQTIEGEDIARLAATLDKMAEAHWANDVPPAKPTKLDPEWIGANDKERQLYERAVGIVANPERSTEEIEIVADIFSVSREQVVRDIAVIGWNR